MPPTPIPSADPLSPALSCCLCGGPAGPAGLSYPDGICAFLQNCFAHSGGSNRTVLTVNGVSQNVDFVVGGPFGNALAGGASSWADLGTGCTPDPSHGAYDFLWILVCTTDPATGKRGVYLTWQNNCFHSSTDTVTGNGIRGVLNSVVPLSISFHDVLIVNSSAPDPAACADCPPPTITATLTGTPLAEGGGCFYP